MRSRSSSTRVHKLERGLEYPHDVGRQHPAQPQRAPRSDAGLALRRTVSNAMRALESAGARFVVHRRWFGTIRRSRSRGYNVRVGDGGNVMPVITVSGCLASGARELAQAVRAARLQLDYVDRRSWWRRRANWASASRRWSSATSAPSRSGSAGLDAALAHGAIGRGRHGRPDERRRLGLGTCSAQTYGEAAELPADGAERPAGRRQLLRNADVHHQGHRRTRQRRDPRPRQPGDPAATTPDTFHVYVAAPREWRVEILVAREGMTPEDARATHREERREPAARSIADTSRRTFENPRL